ncbi:hypothetical protein CMUS01_08186 [Colletotrichum musicola]|uniref:Uncharacterized protein n=1 Tax=Colletotrichum musicola TaxID=2175873 RepID=A0A8H6NDD0_9PEZI|nr:hypothetical protein CMUS01_08186 [Colletotrichum musicola]
MKTETVPVRPNLTARPGEVSLWMRQLPLRTEDEPIGDNLGLDAVDEFHILAARTDAVVRGARHHPPEVRVVDFAKHVELHGHLDVLLCDVVWLALDPVAHNPVFRPLPSGRELAKRWRIDLLISFPSWEPSGWKIVTLGLVEAPTRGADVVERQGVGDAMEELHSLVAREVRDDGFPWPGSDSPGRTAYLTEDELVVELEVVQYDALEQID